MNLTDIKCLYYIAAIENMRSICERGILSYNQVRRISHKSIAMDRIQEKREKVVLPGADGKGKSLHDFAPLYFDAWNPMLSRVRNYNANICLIAINKEILKLPGVIIADRNASSKYCRYAPSPEGLMNIDREAVFRKNWKDTDLINEWRKKSVKCAEALVPYSVSVEFFKGAIVVNDKSAIRLKEKVGERFKDLKILVDKKRFF